MKRTLGLLVVMVLLASNSFTSENSFESLDKFRADGDQYFALGDYGAASKTWEVGLELAKSAKNQQWTAVFLSKLGELSGETGSYDEAFDYLKDSLKAYRAVKDDKGVGESYLRISGLYVRLENYKEALAENEKAIEIFKELKTDKELAEAYINAGRIYEARRDFPQALACLKESLRISRETGDKRLLGENLLVLGRAERETGDFEKAVNNCEEALNSFRSAGDERGSATAFRNLGLAYYAMGDYKKAISCFDRSLDLSEKTGEKTLIADTLSDLGTVYKNLCEYGKAVLYFDNSLRYSIQTGSRQRLPAIYANMGGLYRSIGYREKARGYFTEALKLYKEMDDRKGLAETLVNLGLCCSDGGDSAGAAGYYRDAAETKKKLGLPYRDITALMVDLSLDSGDPAIDEKLCRQLNCPLRLGRLELIRKNYTSAAESFGQAIKENSDNNNIEMLFPAYCGFAESELSLWEYDKAKEIFNEAISIVEAQRQSLSPEEKHDFFSAKIGGFRRSSPYEGIIRALMSTNDPKEAFRYSENLKLGVFAEAAGDTGEFARKQLAVNDAGTEEDYILKVRVFTKEMDSFFKNNRKDEYRAKERELKALAASHDIFAAGLCRTNPDYVFVKYPKAMKPQEINVKPNEVLLEFEVTGEATYLFILRGNDRRFTTRTIARTRDEINGIVNKYRGYVKKNAVTGELAFFDGKYSNEIYGILFGETLKTVPPGTTLVIVPDESLGALPFASLVTSLPEREKIDGGKYGSFPVGARYLSDIYPIAYAQSATALTYLRSKKQEQAAENAGLSICDPLSGQEADGGAGEFANSIRQWSQGSDSCQVYRRFEAAGGLAKNMEILFPGRATALSGQEAKKDNFTQLALSKYKYIAFGANTILDSNIPWLKQPAIVMTPAVKGDGCDGFLTLREIIKLDIPAEAVTLSSCNTPTGPGVTGEYAMDLGRAFQHSGCRHILMSLWNVADDTAVPYNAVFLKNLKEGREPAEAMKNAREDIRGRGFEHPYYWSSFILVSR